MLNFKKAIALLAVITAFAIPLASCNNTETPVDTTDTEVTEAVTERAEPYEITEGDFTFAVDKGKAAIIAYTGTQSDLVIPSEADGKPVTAIEDGIFEGIEIIDTVKLPDTLERIGSETFKDCSYINSINIPETVKVIGANAFENTLWLNQNRDEFVIVGDGVCIKYNGDNTEVTLPEGVKYLSSFLRGNTASITSVKLSSTVETIGVRAFGGIKTVEKIELNKELKKIENSAFVLCSALKELTVPENVEEIGDNAFMHCIGLETIVFENNIQSIPDYSFTGCKALTSVTLPKGLKTIGVCAFDTCVSLAGIEIPDSVEEIGAGAFSGNPSLTATCKAESAAARYFTEAGFTVNEK